MARNENTAKRRQVYVRDLFWVITGAALSLSLIRFGMEYPNHRAIIVNGWFLLWGSIGGLAGKMWTGTVNGMMRGILFVGTPLALVIPIGFVLFRQAVK